MGEFAMQQRTTRTSASSFSFPNLIRTIKLQTVSQAFLITTSCLCVDYNLLPETVGTHSI